MKELIEETYKTDIKNIYFCIEFLLKQNKFCLGTRTIKFEIFDKFTPNDIFDLDYFDNKLLTLEDIVKENDKIKILPKEVAIFPVLYKEESFNIIFEPLIFNCEDKTKTVLEIVENEFNQLRQFVKEKGIKNDCGFTLVDLYDEYNRYKNQRVS